MRAFLALVCPHLQHDTPPLQDVYGPTATDPDVQGLLVSEETRPGAKSSMSSLLHLTDLFIDLIRK